MKLKKKRLAETIRSTVRPETIYGHKGQEVGIRWCDERIAIVEAADGSRFSVLLENLTDEDMTPDPIIETKQKPIINKQVPGIRKKKLQVPDKTNTLFNE